MHCEHTKQKVSSHLQSRHGSRRVKAWAPSILLTSSPSSRSSRGSARFTPSCDAERNTRGVSVEPQGSTHTRRHAARSHHSTATRNAPWPWALRLRGEALRRARQARASQGRARRPPPGTAGTAGRGERRIKRHAPPTTRRSRPPFLRSREPELMTRAYSTPSWPSCLLGGERGARPRPRPPNRHCRRHTCIASLRVWLSTRARPAHGTLSPTQRADRVTAERAWGASREFAGKELKDRKLCLGTPRSPPPRRRRCQPRRPRGPACLPLCSHARRRQRRPPCTRGLRGPTSPAPHWKASHGQLLPSVTIFAID